MTSLKSFTRRNGFACALTTLTLLASVSPVLAQGKPGAGSGAGSGSSGAAAGSGNRSGSTGAAAGGGYVQRFAAECAACHGANGKSEIPGTPHLAGQHSYYAVTQLFLFREGRRSNEAMTAVAKSMKDADLRGFSDFIGTLPPLPATPPAEPLDAARMTRGRELAQQQKCLFCHGPDMSGGQQVPRVAGQREEYLRESLQGYRTGTRVGYTPAMVEPSTPLSEEDADTLAYFVAHLPAANAAGTGK
jgi:cytochrome c553